MTECDEIIIVMDTIATKKTNTIATKKTNSLSISSINNSVKVRAIFCTQFY